ncbi:MAG: hypothetical protein LAN71_02705 [Acidobacteriia bacterium]|nr:hypothetical protein [Terriglobia bacterium]
MQPRHRTLAAVVFAAALAAGATAVFLHLRPSGEVPAVELIEDLPAEASSLVYVDLAALRQSGVLARLKSLAPDAQKEPEYAQFVRDTGFDFERDLDRLAIAIVTRGDTRTFYAAVEGRFDAGKIRALALRSGKQQSRGGQDIFTMPVSGSPLPVSFSFLGNGRILLTGGGEADSLVRSRAADASARERNERALRLAGSPIFGVLHPDPAQMRELSRRFPGGLRSDQLTALAEKIRWVTFAARPDSERTQIVLEAEAISDQAAAQIAELTENLLLLARTALEFSGGRAQLTPAERAAFLDLLQNAQVAQINRGETQAVRLVLNAGPPVIQALLASSPNPAPESHQNREKTPR